MNHPKIHWPTQYHPAWMGSHCVSTLQFDQHWPTLPIPDLSNALGFKCLLLLLHAGDKRDSVEKISYRHCLPKAPLHSEHTRGTIQVLILPTAFSWLWVCSQNSVFSRHSTTALNPGPWILLLCVPGVSHQKKRLTVQSRAEPSAVAECPPGNWGWIFSICSAGDSFDGWYTKPEHS